MLVSNGTDIIPAVNTVIAIAEDDVTYNKLIPKGSISYIDSDINVSVGRYLVTVHYGGRTYEINLAEVTNQPTWSNDSVGILIAIQDINSWLATNSIFSVGLAKITVSSAPPSNPSLNDLWVQI